MYPFFYNQHYGLVDKTGKIILQPQFKTLYKYGDTFYSDKGFFKTPDKITKIAVPMFPFSYGLAPFNFNNKWGLMNKKLKIVVEAKFQNITEFYDGIAAVKYNDKWGFIDTKGNYVIEPSLLDLNTLYTRIYKYDRWTENGIAAVQDEDGWYFIDKHRNDLYSKRYDYAEAFCNGLAVVNLNNKYGYIDENGNEVISLGFNNAFCFDNQGFAEVWAEDDMMIIDREGNICYTSPDGYDTDDIRKDFAKLRNSEKREYFFKKIDDKYGLVSPDGEFVINPIYDEIEEVCSSIITIDEENMSFNITIARIGKKLWIIDTTNDIKVTPMEDVHPIVDLLPDGKTWAYFEI